MATPVYYYYYCTYVSSLIRTREKRQRPSLSGLISIPPLQIGANSGRANSRTTNGADNSTHCRFSVSVSLFFKVVRERTRVLFLLDIRVLQQEQRGTHASLPPCKSQHFQTPCTLRRLPVLLLPIWPLVGHKSGIFPT